MILVFLLCLIAGVPAAGQTLDVCATCHVNATCADKSDGSGKVCNCKYGFVGNGRTFCQDKDECQIEASKICGQQTRCHNTYGSYYCTCLSGYIPTNNMALFIPNDGTHCRDVDECIITGLCGEGGQCRNLEGSFECSCQQGYQVHNGQEPFHPHRDGASCRVVECGQPVLVEDTKLVSVTGTTYGSVATFICEEGFIWVSGGNTSVCEVNGQWAGPTLVCEEVDCGAPPAISHSRMLWNKSSIMGSEVFYQCNSGYHNIGEGNVSICTSAGQWKEPPVLCQETLCGSPPTIETMECVWNGSTTSGSTAVYFCKKGFLNHGGLNLSVCVENGQWTPPALSCQEILCGDPPTMSHTEHVWNGSCTPGSTVIYYCKMGFYHKEGNNVSLCAINGSWTKPNISCEEVQCGMPPHIPHSVMLWDNNPSVGARVVYQCKPGYHRVGKRTDSICTVSGKWDEAPMLCEEMCQEPIFKANAKLLWDGTSKIGSVVNYQCDEGYHTRSQRNFSVCGENGLWEDIDLLCEEISCGPPLTLPHTRILWDHTSRPGSIVAYACVDGFNQEMGNNISVCSLSGEWGEISVNCQAKCGPVPFLANSEVVWHNRSVVIHRCVDGYHSWRGSNVSVCGGSGLWQSATLRCIEIKPPINHPRVLNENCVRWKAEKYEEDLEVYKVEYVGTRDYQRSFRDRRKRVLSSKEDSLAVCLSLLPLTNYSISISAISAKFTATIITNTSLPVPPIPLVYFREFDSPEPTLTLHRSTNTLDTISFYQVFVLPIEDIMVYDCSSPKQTDPLSRNTFSLGYITAQILLIHVGKEMNFTVGDGLHYGGSYNAPLQYGRNYYIVLRAVNQWKAALKSSCVLWAKIKGTSFALRVSSLCAASSVGLLALVILGGYKCIRFLKKK